MDRARKNFEQLVKRVALAIGATEAAAFVVKRDHFECELQCLMHLRPDEADARTRGAAVAAFKDIIIPCVEHAKDGTIEIEGSDDARGKQFCLVSLAHREGHVVSAAAFIVRCPNQHDAALALMRVQREASGK